MMKSKKENNRKRRSTVLKRTVSKLDPGCQVTSLSDNIEKGEGQGKFPPRYNIGGGNGLGSSWPLCWCVNSNYCKNKDLSFPGFTGGSLTIPTGPYHEWYTPGYLDTWIKFINIDQTDEYGNKISIQVKGSGYLFYHMNSHSCGVNTEQDQGLAEVVLINKVSEINATSKSRLNNSVPRLSNSIMNLKNYQVYLNGLTKLKYDEPLKSY